jgi:hypothetical protein
MSERSKPRGAHLPFMVNVDVPRSWQGEVNAVLDQAARNWGQADLLQPADRERGQPGGRRQRFVGSPPPM